MNANTHNKKEDGYPRPWMYSLIVVIAWGLVPMLAKAGNFAGGFTTFWVNIFAAIGVLLIMWARGYLQQFKAYRHYGRFIGLSILWPLAYSLSYFTIINISSGSLATILNYLWPLFALILLSVTGRMKIPPIGWALAILGFAAVSGTLVLEGKVELLALPIMFGMVVPATQALFNVVTSDEQKYPGEYAWLLTFIGAVVTAVGSAIYILAFEGGDFTAGVAVTDLLPLAIIGFGGNTIGFYAFMRAGQLSQTPAARVSFTITMFAIPFAQVLFLVLGVERDISPIRLVGIAFVAVGFLVFKLWENRQKSQIAPAA